MLEGFPVERKCKLLGLARRDSGLRSGSEADPSDTLMATSGDGRGYTQEHVRHGRTPRRA